MYMQGVQYEFVDKASLLYTSRPPLRSAIDKSCIQDKSAKNTPANPGKRLPRWPSWALASLSSATTKQRIGFDCK